MTGKWTGKPGQSRSSQQDDTSHFFGDCELRRSAPRRIPPLEARHCRTDTANFMSGELPRTDVEVRGYESGP